MPNEYTLNINLNSGQSAASSTGNGSAEDLEKVRKTAEESRDKLDAFLNKQEAEEAVSRQRSAALEKANKEKAALTKKHKIEKVAGIGAITVGLSVARYASVQASAINQNQAMANRINNVTTTVGVGAAGAATAGAIVKTAVSGNYVLAALEAAMVLANTTITLVQKSQEWDYNRDKNVSEEVRSSDRLGIVISQRGRMR